MKLKIDYDMLKEIKHSKKGISAAEYFFGHVQFAGPLIINNFGFLVHGIFIRDSFEIIINSSALGLTFAISKMESKFKRVYDIDNAFSNLQDLATSLYKLEVNTTAELLQDSEMLESHLKFRFVDNKPMIIEKIYIDVPLSNGYKETILQEHRFGSKDWEISVEEPDKKVAYKLARGKV